MELELAVPTGGGGGGSAVFVGAVDDELVERSESELSVFDESLCALCVDLVLAVTNDSEYVLSDRELSLLPVFVESVTSDTVLSDRVEADTVEADTVEADSVEPVDLSLDDELLDPDEEDSYS